MVLRNCQTFALVVGLVAILIALKAYLKHDKLSLLQHEVRRLRSQYRSQSNCTWLTIYAALKPIAVDNSTNPAVLLLLTDQDGCLTAHKMAEELVVVSQLLVNTPCHQVTFVGGYYRHVNLVNSFIIECFCTLRKNRVLLVRNIHDLHYKAAEQLHDLTADCIGESVIILVMYSKDVVYDRRSAMKSAEKKLREAWKGIDEAKAQVIFKRILVNIININQETNLELPYCI